MFRSPPRLALICLISALLAAPAAFPDDLKSYKLVVHDHVFQPEKLTLPAGKRVKLIIANQDATPMEFESYDLDREKVIVGNASAKIYLGPLEPGEYNFFDDFHRDSASGTIVIKPAQQ